MFVAPGFIPILEQILVINAKGVLSLSIWLKTMGKTDEDKKYVAIYGLKKNERIK